MKTFKIRIKDKHSKVLDALARDVNMVWNYCNDLCYRHLQRTGKYFSSYDLQKYTAGSTKKGLTINSATVQMIDIDHDRCVNSATVIERRGLKQVFSAVVASAVEATVNKDTGASKRFIRGRSDPPVVGILVL